MKVAQRSCGKRTKIQFCLQVYKILGGLQSPHKMQLVFLLTVVGLGFLVFKVMTHSSPFQEKR